MGTVLMRNYCNGCAREGQWVSKNNIEDSFIFIVNYDLIPVAEAFIRIYWSD